MVVLFINAVDGNFEKSFLSIEFVFSIVFRESDGYIYAVARVMAVNPFFRIFCFFLTIIENMPYRTQISPQNSRKERISRSFLKPLRGYDGFNSLLYHLGNLCCLHSLVFLVWDRVEKMDFYRYGTDGIGVKRNKTVF